MERELIPRGHDSELGPQNSSRRVVLSAAVVLMVCQGRGWGGGGRDLI